MLTFTDIAAAILVAAFITVLVNFRFLMYPVVPSLNPVIRAKRLRLSGNTLFISDLHLRSNQAFSYAKDLRNFIETNNVSNLVIDGDLFDSPKDGRKILGTTRSEGGVLKALGLEGSSTNIFWVVGSPPHDPVDVANEEKAPNGITVLGDCVIMDCGRLEVIVYHGHDMSNRGVYGHLWDRLVSRLSLEREWKRFAKVDKAVWIIFGHTHIPGVDARNRVANCGGWSSNPIVRPSGTGIFLLEGENIPELVSIV
jgi:UDP-2,3-diacylglucosamine pyrophosphatase LpxH